ncbi:MAG: PepSY-associated TM helix domain-containing protein [Alphaproteobacteria bacterium]|nr:PepSY-associated TM helix domain-containing protein [Alphaproteobacteria bacterium]
MDTETTPRTLASRTRRRPPGVLLFLPAALNRGDVIQWLKRVHAWTGFWGALIFLLLGVSGVLLNHRSVLKIDTGEPVEVMSVVLAVDPGAITSAEDLGVWARKEFGTDLEPRVPRPAAPGPEAKGAGAVVAEPVRFMGQDRQPVEVWKQAFTAPNGVLTVAYSPGSSTVEATKTEQNGLGVIKNLHKGSGMGIAWILFIDTIAGSLIAMSLTGALLWSRLHGPRLAAVAIIAASLGVALMAGLPRLL